MTMLMNQVNGSVLPLLLNGRDKDFNDTLTVFDKPRIFKIVLEEVSYWKNNKEYVSSTKCEMFQEHVKICNDLLLNGMPK